MWPVNSLIDWALVKFEWKDEDAPKFNLRETITGWVTDFWNWFTGWLPDISKIAADLKAEISAILPDWIKNSLDLGPDTSDADTQTRYQNLLSNISQYDLNGDGKISKDELPSNQQEYFSLSGAMMGLSGLRGENLTMDDMAQKIRQGQTFNIVNNTDASATQVGVNNEAPKAGAPNAQPFGYSF